MSNSGSRAAAWKRRRGFTLLEVVLVIALIAVGGTLFVVSLESFGNTSPADEFEGAFWRAMGQAREQALASRQSVELSWSAADRAFVLSGVGGEQLVPVPAEAEASGAKCAAEFSTELAANDFILVRGALVTRRPIEVVRIFPDGTCQPFAVEFSLGATKHLVQIDPWTGAEMLPPESAGKGGGA